MIRGNFIIIMNKTQSVIIKSDTNKVEKSIAASTITSLRSLQFGQVLKLAKYNNLFLILKLKSQNNASNSD